MYVHFDRSEMRRISDTYQSWWDGTAQKPLLSLREYHAYERKRADGPTLSQENCHDFSRSPKEIIEAWDCELSDIRFTADGYPWVSLTGFGPGILAAMVGGSFDNSSGAVWFGPGEKTELSEIHPVYNPENKFTKRIKDIYYAGLEYWDGAVIMSFPDLGGVLDVCASLRGTENLLLDLYDDPVEVLRLVADVEKAWRAAYDDLGEVLRPQGGYTDWSGIFSPVPSYIVQSDFCYMISNPMFREFVLPTIKRDTETLQNTVYHLDGPGELIHLDDILALEKLNAVQWIPGSGNPPVTAYPEVYEKIVRANKGYWVCGNDDEFFKVYEKAGGRPFFSYGYRADDTEKAKRFLPLR